MPDVLAASVGLDHIHFSVDRVSVESVMRLLIEQFDVPTHAPPDIWRPALRESETIFAEIAHRPLSRR